MFSLDRQSRYINDHNVLFHCAKNKSLLDKVLLLAVYIKLLKELSCLDQHH